MKLKENVSIKGRVILKGIELTKEEEDLINGKTKTKTKTKKSKDAK